MNKKPLGRKAYGSIPHLPGSKIGPGDHHITEGQARILTEKPRDKHDRVYVHEKLDGSNVCVAKLADHRIVALSRSGYLVESSPYLQHHIFGDWVYSNKNRFQDLLRPGERVCGEWLAQAHGTLYELNREPFIIFDLLLGDHRFLYRHVTMRVSKYGFQTPHWLNCIGHDDNHGAYSVDQAIHDLKIQRIDHIYGCNDEPQEGAVWRVERKGEVDFLAKWVRPDFIPGKYLPSVSGNGKTVWNQGLEKWLPPKALDRISLP